MIRFRRAIQLMVLIGAGFLLVSCLKEGPVLNPDEAQDREAQTQDCQDVLGQAFTSAAQRQWFLEHCSNWRQQISPVSTERTPSEAAEEENTDSAECAAMRGKPYESSEQRQWFLANCVDNPPTNAPSNGSSLTQAADGDRTTCGSIRGTEYRSQTERQWFLTNCVDTNPPDEEDDDGRRGNGNGNGNGNGRGNRNR